MSCYKLAIIPNTDSVLNIKSSPMYELSGSEYLALTYTRFQNKNFNIFNRQTDSETFYL